MTDAVPPAYPGHPGGPDPTPVTAPAKPPVRTWDVVVTTILIIGLAMLAALMSFFGFFLAMAGDSCGARDCDSGVLATGLITAVVLPWVFLLIAAIIAVVQLVRRKLAFWIPLVGIPFVISAWFIGAFIASLGVSSL